MPVGLLTGVLVAQLVGAYALLHGSDSHSPRRSQLADFWWIGSGITTKQELLAAPLALLALGSATTIVRQERSPSGRPASVLG